MTIDEKKLADDFASGKFKKKKTSLKELKQMALKTKEARINLRLTEDVLDYFHKLSDKEGIPYQTLINSALHKIATGQLVEAEKADLKRLVEELKAEITELKKLA